MEKAWGRICQNSKGTILTLVAGICMGRIGTSGQYLMTHGFPVLVLTDIRLLNCRTSVGIVYDVAN